jgi:MFS family permease
MPLFLLADPSLPVLAAGAALVGLSTGAEADMLAFFAARYFGLRRFGAIFGTLGLFFGLSVAVGGVSAGFLFDRAGDYRLMLMLGAAMAGISGLALLASGLAKGRPARAEVAALEPAAAA